jgi:hypothetical protein
MPSAPSSCSVADKVVPIEEVQLALVEQRAGLKPTIAEPAAAIKEPGTAAAAEEGGDGAGEDNDLVSPTLKTRRSDLRGRTPHQIQYLKAVLEHDISFGIGPAGTGKTYLAVACAVDALERDAVKRIILTRPAVEAGERLGFLPGDFAQKVDPYLRPLYDALYDLLGFDRTQKLFEKQVIEIAPLAFMRGRTLNHAFVILDDPDRFRQQGRDHRRRDPGRPAQDPAQRPGRCDARAEGRTRHRFQPILECRRGAPPAGGPHRRRLRQGGIDPGDRCPAQDGDYPKCKKKNINSSSTSSTPTPAWKPRSPPG